MPIEITDEMRRAVLLEMCAQQGHQLDVSQAVGSASGEQTNDEVRGPDESRLPFICCIRCGRVWLVVETGADSYEEAESGAFEQLHPETPFRKRIQELRDKRRSA